MKKFKLFIVSVIAIVCLVVSSGVFTSCTNDDDQLLAGDSRAEYTNVNIEGITVDSFPQELIFTENTALENGIGLTCENAIVPLIFDENGYLCTGQKYNSPDFIDSCSNHLITDLRTFHKVTNMKEATPEYSRLLPISKGKNIWAFDPYVNHFEKRKDIQKYRNPEAITRTIPSSIWAVKGNIIYGKWNNDGIADYLGHVGAISVLPSNPTDVISSMMQITKTIEASNLGGTFDPILGGSPNGVFERYMSTNGYDAWNHSSIYDRCVMWYPNMTSTQRNLVINYMQGQIGKYYALSSKTNETTWYCSKLVWKAYNVALNIDIDYNQGTYVFPDDIYNSPLLTLVYF